MRRVRRRPACAWCPRPSRSARSGWPTQLGREASLAYNESISLHLRGELDVARVPARRARPAAAPRRAARDASPTTGCSCACRRERRRSRSRCVDLGGARRPGGRARGDRASAMSASPSTCERGPLVRAELVRLAADHHVLVAHRPPHRAGRLVVLGHGEGPRRAVRAATGARARRCRRRRRSPTTRSRRRARRRRPRPRPTSRVVDPPLRRRRARCWTCRPIGRGRAMRTQAAGRQTTCCPPSWSRRVRSSAPGAAPACSRRCSPASTRCCTGSPARTISSSASPPPGRRPPGSMAWSGIACNMLPLRMRVERGDCRSRPWCRPPRASCSMPTSTRTSPSAACCRCLPLARDPAGCRWSASCSTSTRR